MVYNKFMVKYHAQNKTLLVVLLIVLFVISLVVNGLSSTTLIGGNTTAEVSNDNPTLFTPAGVTFAVWAIIYMLLIGYVVHLIVAARQKKPKTTDDLTLRVAPYFAAITICNIAWLFAWQYRVFWLSILIIGALLWLLAKVNLLIKGEVSHMRDWLTITLPFAVYFGWVTVATIANISVWLVNMHWDGWGIAPDIWTIIILFVATVIGIVTAWRLRCWPYMAVFVWAYFGVWLNHTSETGYNGTYSSIISVITVCIGLFAVVAGWLLYKYPLGKERK